MATRQEKYIVCSINGESEAMEAGAWVLFESGAEGIIQEENGSEAKVSAYFPEKLWESIKPELLKNFETAKEQFSSLRMEDGERVDPIQWTEKWKEYYKPVIIGSLWIGPPWLRNEAPADNTTLTIDPGLAFGTGGHETTKICLALLNNWILDGGRGRVLDVGTGSGILALAGLQMGLESSLALDNDPAALEAARDNALANGLETRITVSDSPLAEIEEQFPLITANLTGSTLKANAKNLIRLLVPGGNLILSGLLIGETDLTRRVFRELRFVKALEIGDWTGLLMRKPGES